MALLADRYELAESLGSGGMAHVVAASDRRLGRRVAVKLIHDHLAADDNIRARLLHEARAAAAFHHPCAVAVFDVGEEADRPFVVMELVAGETLSDRLARVGTLSAADTAAIGSCLVDALGAAHRRGLVHRDVKPANVLLPREGGVKLADFGIAKGLATSVSGLTATGQIVGTPSYISPEQAGGYAATARSDLYALGVVLYECLAGTPPFFGENAVAVALAHQQEPPPPLLQQAPGTPPALAAVVERSLAKDPGDRYADAESMRSALEDAVHEIDAPPTIDAPAATVPLDLPGTAGGSTVPARDRRVWRRAGLAAALSAATLGALALVVSLAAGEGQPDDVVDNAGEHQARLDEAEDAEEAASLEHDASLEELIGVLSRDPEGAGDRGPELLNELVDLGRSDDRAARSHTARHLAMDVSAWMADDGLDSDVGDVAIDVLERESRPAPAELAPVSDLFAEVAADKPAWGAAADDLLAELAHLLSDHADDWEEPAANLVAMVSDWIEAGDLDPDRGQAAITVLQPLADRSTDGDPEDQRDEPTDDEDGTGEGGSDGEDGPGRGNQGRGNDGHDPPGQNKDDRGNRG